MKQTIPILLVNVTMRFPTKRHKIYKFKTYLKKVTKGTTPQQAFKFLRVSDKNECDMYCVEIIKKVGNTSVIDS